MMVMVTSTMMMTMTGDDGGRDVDGIDDDDHPPPKQVLPRQARVRAGRRLPHPGRDRVGLWQERGRARTGAAGRLRVATGEHLCLSLLFVCGSRSRGGGGGGGDGVIPAFVGVGHVRW